MSFRVFGYGRASTDGQVLSTNQQCAVIVDAFGAYQKIKSTWTEAVWAGFFADEATGRTSIFRERNNGSLLLAACDRGDVIMVSNYDRIFANVVDVCDTLKLLDEQGIRLIVLDCEIDTTTPIGAFCFKILALVKELEVVELRRRTRESAANRKRLGIPWCGPMVGWRTVVMLIPGSSRPQKYLVPDNRKRRLAREIHKIAISHGMNLRQARFFCNDNKIYPPHRKYWTQPTFEKWIDAAINEFILPNGNHQSAPIPANAVPYAPNTISDGD
jgi:DNA invertase Pin-like site-specific DNA recombinase